MNLISKIKKSFYDHLEKDYGLSTNDLESLNFDLNVDQTKEEFGDINTNAAMILAKKLQKKPYEIAKQIKKKFSHELVEKMDVAGPGFLNIYLKLETFKSLVSELITNRQDFFRLSEDVKKKKFNIEFVSANPTGPLHIGHGRGGIIGDVLANILQFIGHKATREFYINDAGAQIAKLGISFKTRCQQAAGICINMPEDGYQGEYLVDLAKKFVSENKKEILSKPESFFGQYAKEKMLDQLKKTLQTYGINFDVWFSERSLHTSGEVEAAFKILEQKGYLYEKDNALWFKSTEFGDDKDRVVKKSSGDLTYVASDIAYMKNKTERGFDNLIMILGHDHHSYGVRLEGLRQALGLDASLEIILYQLVKMKSSGQLVRMSKRTGNIVTLKEIIDTVGADVARFFYLNRKSDAQLEFNLDLALEKTDANPVYYVQYALVRIKSILEKAKEASIGEVSPNDVANIGDSERFLIKKIVSLKQLLENISHNYHTHLLTYFIIELANTFHRYYSKNRIIDKTNIEQSKGRLILIKQLKNTFEICFDLIGISKPERM